MNRMTKIFFVLVIGTFFIGCSKNQKIIKSEENENLPFTVMATQSFDQELKYIADYTIKLAFSTNLEDPRAIASSYFKTIVEEQTSSRIKVELYPDAVLGSDSELISKVIKGDVDITISSAGNYAAYVTAAGYSAMPFLFSDFDEAWRFLDSKANIQINKLFENYNMYVLCYFDNGFRCVTTSADIGPVKSVKDMKNLLIRTSQNQIVMETMVQLDAIPKSFPFGQLKEALANKTFTAQENPIPVIYNNKLYEVQKYLAITNHSYDAMPFTINKNLWEHFSPEDKEIIKNAALSAQTLNRQLVKKQTDDYLVELEKKGMKITYPNLADFKQSTQEVFKVFEPVYGTKLLEELKNF